MTQPSLHHISCPDKDGGHNMSYWEWGDPLAEHVVLCVHGLTRQGRDFDSLARALAPRCRVIAVDIVGRGESDWLHDPMLYSVPQYASDMGTLVAQVMASQPKMVDWVGTSMGGLIGMVVCGQSGAPIRRLVLNDVGPALAVAAVERIKSYVGVQKRFNTLQEGADYLWTISQSFGPHTPEQWLALSRPMLSQDAGQYKLHYDPAIGTPFRATTPDQVVQGEAMLWQLYDAISAKTLVTRGAQSDLLTPETALAMQQRGPKPRVVSFEGVGHAPTFVANDQIDTVTAFLLDA